MSAKPNKLIFFIIVSILFITSCSSEYNRIEKEYNKLFEKTVSMLDVKNVYQSIVSNNLVSNLEKLNELMEKIEESSPTNNKSSVDEYMIIKQKHELLTEVIEKGQNWDTLGELDKFMYKKKIESIR